MTTCKNCNASISENYCPNCGEPAKLKRIDRHYIIHEIEHVLHFEKGILYTIKELLVRPGQNVRTFVSENRSRLVKPILFIIVSSLIYSVIMHFFHIKDGYVALSTKEESTTTLIFNWIQNNYGYANIVIGIFIALWLKLFFRKYKYNFFEILILLCFIMGIGMLVFSVFAIIEGLTQISLMQVSSIITLVYFSWAIGQFFEGKAVNYIKALIAYILGMVTFAFSAIFLGLLVDLIKQ